MRKYTQAIKQHSALILLASLLSEPVYAYIDPGTGSMMLQIVIATVVAGLATARYWWYRLLSLFGINKKNNIEDQSPHESVNKRQDEEPKE